MKYGGGCKCCTTSVCSSTGCPTTSGGKLCVNVSGCLSSGAGGSLSGVPVDFTQSPSSTPFATVNTDSSGNACACAPASFQNVTYAVNSPPARYGTVSAVEGGSNFGTCNSNHSVFLSLPTATGYACVCACAQPVSTTLHLTDSLFGTSLTLTYSGTQWSGSATGSVAACAFQACSAVTGVPVSYLFPVLAGGGSCGVQVTYPYVGIPPNICVATSGSTTSSTVALTPSPCPPGAVFTGTYTYAPGCSSGTVTISE